MSEDPGPTERLRRGTGHAPPAEVPGDDREVARELVAAVARAALSDLRVGEAVPAPAEPAPASDGSFLGRLASHAAEGRPGISDLADVRTLLAVLRGGNLAQRRAAAERVRELLGKGDLDGREIEAIEGVLGALRDPDIAFEVGHARAALPGEAGDEARDEEEPWARTVAGLEDAIRAYWEGETEREPVSALLGEERAWIVMRARQLPDRVIAHLAAVLEGVDGSADEAARRALLESLRVAGDPRLLPSLVALLGTGGPGTADAARALGRIDDPRARPALLSAYRRSAVDAERAVLAGALGMAGDPQGLGYLRALLAGEDGAAIVAATEAMEAIAAGEDVERLVPLLGRADRALVALAVRALGRIGDGRAVGPLEALLGSELPGGLRAEVEDALASVRAQLELRGEEPPVVVAPARLVAAGLATDAPRPENFWARARGRIDFVLGRLWLAIGAAGRAIEWFELAALRRPRWAAPLAQVALAHVRRGELARALGAFRRALDADRRWVERERPVVRTLAQVVLRRAEEMEGAGRVDIARGLLDEILDLDLRGVPSNVRFELRRRRRALGAGSAAGRASWAETA